LEPWTCNCEQVVDDDTLGGRKGIRELQAQHHYVDDACITYVHQQVANEFDDDDGERAVRFVMSMSAISFAMRSVCCCVSLAPARSADHIADDINVTVGNPTCCDRV